MAGFRSSWKYWLPVAVWMVLIFSASTSGMSFGRTGRFIEPFLRWIDPDMSREAVLTWIAVIRKAAHVVEYAILGILLWWALRQPKWKDPRPWSWRQSAAAFALATVYAVTDELHQALVPSRGASPVDVSLDMLGAACGILLVWAMGRCFNRW